jgi:tRNA pseudouridine55 synthase
MELIIANEITYETDFPGGQLLLVDKPLEWTSFDVVKRIRGAISRRLGVKKIKVGHSGTLDPLASGLVLIGTGKGTKWLHDLQGLDKAYIGSMKFGATTPTYDAEMPEEDITDCSHLSIEKVKQGTSEFLGWIDQVPPLYSAVKIDGQPAYKAARKGKSVEISSRKVRIDKFDVNKAEWPEVKFEVACSKGTYIRSLVHDLGQNLGVGAYLTSLRRTKVGDFSISDAWPLDDLLKAIEGDPGQAH